MRSYRVEYVQLTGWELDVVGLWLAENDDWLLLRAIPADYVVDGYVLLAKAHIVSREPGRYRKQTELILRLKGISADVPPDFAFLEVVDMLRWVERQYGLVEFTDEEKCTFFGWVKEADGVHFWADTLTPKGAVLPRNGGEPPFVITEIQTIRFDTDYFNSLKVLWQYRTHSKAWKPSDN